MKPCLKVVLRPLCFLVLLGLSGYMVIKLSLMTKADEHTATSQSHEIRQKVFSEIETTAKLTLPLNISASNLASALSSYLNGTQLSFLAIETKVAPTLFLAISTIPGLSQVGFVGSNGLSFSFYRNEEKGQTLAIFHNATYSSKWYSQLVNRDTGKLYGDAIIIAPPIKFNQTWLGEALNNTNGFASLGTSWNHVNDLQFSHFVAMDGRGIISLGFLAKRVIDHFNNMDFHGGIFHLATMEGRVLVQNNALVSIVASNNTIVVMRLQTPYKKLGAAICKIACKDGDDDNFRPERGYVNGDTYIFYCSTIEIAGIRSVYVIAFPNNGILGLVRKNGKMARMLLFLVFITVLISIIIFMYFIVRATRREVFLCAALLKQMDATQQAERKSMNKSVAFASASHDARASLAAITGLIDNISHEESNSSLELMSNLMQMKTCSNDLLGILNTVLDTSKIEAGKMQLEEEEFNLAQFLEEVVDLYYIMGMKKGIDVVLDPCDGSILKTKLVRGDRGKLKQILSNLLGNAIKFTSEGHVSVRAMVKKVSLENSIIASNHNIWTKCLSWLCYKDTEDFKELDTLHTVQHDPNHMEFEFEVDDTGKGIPRDKWKYVFENFVQVNETSQGQEGVGLGLGIVQSLVRLMGGEIGIIDKEPGERGTCFKFNIFLTVIDNTCNDVEDERNHHWYLGLHIRPSGPKFDGSLVVLLMASDERRRVSKRLIESLGIRVSSVKQVRDLFVVLEKLKDKVDLPNHSQSRKVELSLMELFMSASTHENPSTEGSIKDGNGYASFYNKKSNFKSSTNFILIVVDARAGPLDELCSIVANFRQDIPSSRCKVVWLDNRTARAQLSNSNEVLMAPPCDHMLSKPFHGSQLYQVLSLLPEYGGVLGNSTSTPCNGNKAQNSICNHNHQLNQIVVHDYVEDKIVKPLIGKRILVVEDSMPLRKVTTAILRKLGAEFDVCENGKQALDQVSQAISDGDPSKVYSYDCIFMDCLMPVMDGYEATRLIRMEEKQHGIHIPIIALTAHATAEETRKTLQAGMDFYLTKPLSMDKLLEVIHSLDKK